MNDEELLEQFRKTDEPALLEELVRRNLDRVYRFVASMVGNRDCVDDLVQSVLLSVVQNIERFRGESALSTWIYRIASNKVRRYFETTKKPMFTTDFKGIEPVHVTNHDPLEFMELRQLLDDAIGELSPSLRAAILLTCVEGLTPEEAAQVEGCSAANIHWRVHKARTILKKRLEKYEEK